MNVQAQSHHNTGRSLAMLGSSLLIADSLVMLAAFVTVFRYSWFNPAALEYMFGQGSLPMALYAVWALTIFGTVSCVIALTLYEFRSRWFWNCLLGNAILWLFFSPLHAVVGIISIILLIRSRSAFVAH